MTIHILSRQAARPHRAFLDLRIDKCMRSDGLSAWQVAVGSPCVACTTHQQLLLLQTVLNAMAKLKSQIPQLGTLSTSSSIPAACGIALLRCWHVHVQMPRACRGTGSSMRERRSLWLRLTCGGRRPPMSARFRSAASMPMQPWRRGSSCSPWRRTFWTSQTAMRSTPRCVGARLPGLHHAFVLEAGRMVLLRQALGLGALAG